jgi:DNA-binding NtrC family response regulator
MRAVFGMIERVAPTELPVLVTGETGTGKELVARALHELGLRKQKPFVTLDCGALPPTLIESALFGYERGAFTGADREYAGVFERAHGGTLFLDELGELPLDLQPKLLRAVERGEIERLRGEGAVRVDVRIIAATNRSLEEMVAEKRFRSDLYYRLAVVHLALPALRERPGDLSLLVEHFLDRFGQARVRFEPDAMALLSRHSFPGNVRELVNLVRRLSVLSAGDRISAAELQPHLTPAAEGAPAPQPADDWSGLSFKDAKSKLVDHFEREYLEHVLKRHRFNVSGAAREAGIGRRHFHRLLEKYGISTRKEA